MPTKLKSKSTSAGGTPNIVIVGLPDTAVKESRDRVTTAITNSGYRWPRGRTTINLAPADIKKEGPSFDLPIALGMIAVSEEIDPEILEKFSFVGELALTGAVRSVKGVLADCVRSASSPTQGAHRSRSERARGRDGGRHRHLRRAEFATDVSVSARRNIAHCRRAAT